MHALLHSSGFQNIARAGLIAKGIVYCLLGALVFLSAFRISGGSLHQSDKKGVIQFIQDLPAGKVLLIIVAVGLACYSLWRFIQCFGDSNDKGNDLKGIAARARYFFSGIVYGSLMWFIIKIIFTKTTGDGGGGNEHMVRALLEKPLGEWMVGIAAVIIAGTGIYQLWYGLSEKYRKHAGSAGGQHYGKLLLAAGKIGYMSRGIVWLIIAWLFVKAALQSNAAQAGSSKEAFQFLSHAMYGTYLLGAVAFGLCCYGIFNFIRARFEQIS